MLWISLFLSFLLFKATYSIDDSSDRPVAQSLKSLPPGPPRITESPTSQLVQGPIPTRLYCRAEGNPIPQISWLKDGSPLASAEVRDIVKLPSGDLMFLEVHDKDEEGSTTGIYQCIATNAYGSVRSQNVSVQVTSLDKDFRKEPSDAIVAVGGAVTIQCQGPRGIPEPEISWLKDNRRVVTSGRIKIKPGGNLRITALRKSDSGRYECIATNTVGTRTSSAAELRVQEPPRFVIRPSDVTTTAGQTIVLECKASGDPTPRIRWSKRGGKLSSRCMKLRGGRLKLTDVQLEDQGEYVCSAENLVGKESSAVNITVEMKPEIVRKSALVTSLVGAKSTLVCRVRGNPRPKIFWRNPKGVEFALENSLDEERMIVDSNGDLIIRKTSQEDRGLYKCQAFSSLGSVTAEIQLVVKSMTSNQPPPVVVTVPWNTTALLGSIVELHCSVRDGTIRWYNEGRTIDGASDRFRVLDSGNLRISNVQLEDSGSYTCEASNENGINSWSAFLFTTNKHFLATPLNFKESIPKPPSQPVSFNSTSNCVSVMWNPPQDETNIEYYFISYYQIGSKSFVWEKVRVVVGLSYVLCNLQPTSKYVFVVRAVNENGVGSASQISNIVRTNEPLSPSTTRSTLKEINSIFIELIGATRLTQSGSEPGSIRLEWRTNGSCDTVDYFMLITQPISSSNIGLLTHQSSCSSRSYDLTGLKPTMMYEVRIRPLKMQSAGPASSIKFVSAEAGLLSPSAPDLSVKSNGGDVTLRWKRPRDLPPTYVVGYKIRYWSRDDVTRRVINVNSSTTEFLLKQLDPGTYDVTVTYRTQMGEGVTSDAMEAVVDTASITGIFENPAVIAAIAGGFLLVCIVIAVILYCKRSRRKTKFQGKKRSDRKRCSDDFDLHPVLLPAQHQLNAVEQEVHYVAGGSNVSHVTTKTARNQMRGIDEPYSSTAPNSPGFQFQEDQFNMEQVVGPTWRPTGQLSAQQQMTQHPLYLLRHQSESSGYVAPNPSHLDPRHLDPYRHQYPSSDLPPPPPTPPVSVSSPHFSQRSRTNSGQHSTGDRSSRSGHRPRRSVRSKRRANASQNLLEESQSDITTTPLIERTNNHPGTPSSLPPVPPPRDDSSYQNFPLGRNPSRGNQWSSSNLYPDNVSEMIINNEADQLGDLKPQKAGFNNFNPRNSTNVSNVSMMNGYGSESDARDSFCDRGSDNFSCSDNESFQMDSVSQIGPNRSENHNKLLREQQLYDNDPQAHHYPRTYNNYPLETFQRNDGELNANLPPLRNPPKKSHHPKTLNSDLNRVNSTGSFSSYHQSTGDSGMSAGVGCSTAQSSSLKSYLSAGSAGRPVASRSDGTGDKSLLPDDAATFATNRETEGQDTSRLFPSNVSMTMPSNGSRSNSHVLLKQGHSSRMLHHRLQDSKRNLQIYPNRTPLSPIQSPDVDLSYSSDERKLSGSGNSSSSFSESKTHLYNDEFGNKSHQLRQQELPDVPEVSTSDFCEN